MRHQNNLSLIKKIMKSVDNEKGSFEVTRSDVTTILGCSWEEYLTCRTNMLACGLVCEDISFIGDPKPLTQLTLLGALLYDSKIFEDV